MVWIAQLLTETYEIAREQLLHSGVDVFVLVPNVAHQLTDDLRIRLSVEPVILRPRLAEDFNQCAMYCTTTRAIGQEQRTVDVE